MNPTLWSAYEKLGKLGDNLNPGKIFSDNKHRGYESTQNKKLNTPISAKKKKEEEVRRLGNPSQFPKRKNSVHGKDASDCKDPANIAMMSLLRRFGEGYQLLCTYQCLEAIEEFKKLPLNQHNTGWVLTTIARAYMEVVRYNEASNYYEQAYKLEPYRLEGIEYYSSCLWHQKKHVDLCYLAHQSLEKSVYAVSYTHLTLPTIYSV